MAIGYDWLRRADKAAETRSARIVERGRAPLRDQHNAWVVAEQLARSAGGLTAGPWRS